MNNDMLKRDLSGSRELRASYAELVEALELCFRRLEHKAATCKNHHWKVDDQAAFEKAQAALTKARK
jgi:hypothetical protein